MALTQSDKALIHLIRNLSQDELTQEGRIEQMDVLAFGSPNMLDATTGMTDAELEEQYPGSGLTNQVLRDAAFGLKLLVTGGAGAGIANCKAALTIVANLPA